MSSSVLDSLGLLPAFTLRCQMLALRLPGACSVVPAVCRARFAAICTLCPSLSWTLICGDDNTFAFAIIVQSLAYPLPSIIRD